MFNQTKQAQLILASASTYRKELLSRLRLPFIVISPDINETPLPDELPQETALRLAQAKAETIAGQHPGAIVIGSDQVALLDGQQISKPGTHENALAQLLAMQGRSVIFHTALCVLDATQLVKSRAIQLRNIETQVTFRNLPASQLDAYLRIEQPYDCAGSAKNEGLGIVLIESINSNDPTALTGLPLIALTSMLLQAGVSFFGNSF
ncbi:Maf-like protein [Actimicrobium sp. CCC2.4]|uniref:Maf-like protein n=1 Tax=Actimicrobium sp. CCC2.4 TaxID=3048606 RepID=UPI002AC8DE38|nr:Maf-like protein [Actimicrobium sp. CCC2.4]MEB0135580.1 Maf-like protein [Actimicrobium sp. CCC2.4]WPX33856.1 Maf-like protein [Actimicrobium sp. CCC2.4]